jgi:adenylylsulfate kinase
LYKKARAGQIPEFTGISAPYEEPANPEIVLKTAEADLDACATQLLEELAKRGFVSL